MPIRGISHRSSEPPQVASLRPEFGQLAFPSRWIHALTRSITHRLSAGYEMESLLLTSRLRRRLEVTSFRLGYLLVILRGGGSII